MIHNVAKQLEQMQPELLARNNLTHLLTRSMPVDLIRKGILQQVAQDGLTGYHGGYAAGSQLLDQDTVVTRFVDTTAFPVPTPGLTSGDTYTLIAIPALSVLKEVIIVVHTVEGAADTVDIADSGTTFINDVSTNSAVATTGTNVPKYYPSALNLWVLANAAITVAKFFVIARYQKLDIRY